MSEVYIRPCEQDGISDDFWDHVARGSVNPGLDYVCAWGDQAWASKTGTVASISNSIGGSGGRYILIAWDDGTESYYLHLSRIEVVRGQRVAQHENVAKTGASGFGSEFGYGAHLHFTIRINGANVDPLPLVRSPDGAGWASAGGASTPIEAAPKFTITEDDEMKLIWDTAGTGYLITANGSTTLSKDEYNLFFRVITSDQNRTPFFQEMKAFTPVAVEGQPHTFTAAEVAAMDAALARIYGDDVAGTKNDINTHVANAVRDVVLQVKNVITRERWQLAKIKGRDTIFAINTTTGAFDQFKNIQELLDDVRYEKVSSYEVNGARVPEPAMEFDTLEALNAFITGLRLDPNSLAV